MKPAYEFVFVSHVSEDRATAEGVVNELERSGIPCWIAPRDVTPGRSFDEEIAEAIETCKAMLLVFSDQCNESEYIRREITCAGDSGKVIIPFRIEDARQRGALRVRLSDLHWIDAYASPEKAIDEVIRTLQPNRQLTAEPASDNPRKQIRVLPHRNDARISPQTNRTSNPPPLPPQSPTADSVKSAEQPIQLLARYPGPTTLHVRVGRLRLLGFCAFGFGLLFLYGFIHALGGEGIIAHYSIKDFGSLKDAGGLTALLIMGLFWMAVGVATISKKLRYTLTLDHCGIERTSRDGSRVYLTWHDDKFLDKFDEMHISFFAFGISKTDVFEWRRRAVFGS
jgi:hypothetical protein